MLQPAEKTLEISDLELRVMVLNKLEGPGHLLLENHLIGLSILLYTDIISSGKKVDLNDLEKFCTIKSIQPEIESGQLTGFKLYCTLDPERFMRQVIHFFYKSFSTLDEKELCITLDQEYVGILPYAALCKTFTRFPRQLKDFHFETLQELYEKLQGIIEPKYFLNIHLKQCLDENFLLKSVKVMIPFHQWDPHFAAPETPYYEEAVLAPLKNSFGDNGESDFLRLVNNCKQKKENGASLVYFNIDAIELERGLSYSRDKALANLLKKYFLLMTASYHPTPIISCPKDILIKIIFQTLLQIHLQIYPLVIKQMEHQAINQAIKVKIETPFFITVIDCLKNYLETKNNFFIAKKEIQVQAVLNIFCNKNLSNDFKMLAFYTLQQEEHGTALGAKLLAQCPLPGNIQTRVLQYAHQQDLFTTQNSLDMLISMRERVLLLIQETDIKNLASIDEESLIAQMMQENNRNDEQNQKSSFAPATN